MATMNTATVLLSVGRFPLPRAPSPCLRRFLSQSYGGCPPGLPARWCTVAEEVHSALQVTPNRVIALESTVITHGLPWPLNLETAIALEDIVRQKGCIPATIAVLYGHIHAGLSTKQLERLAKSTESVKLSKRDLCIALSKGFTGGTTVSATSFLAARLGIALFATGGLGGVHRGVGETWDISNDLRELGGNPTTIVCAGVKSILDIAKSLEYLETEGVLVAAFGTDEFPAFYTAHSGIPAPQTVRDAAEAAEVVATNRQLLSQSGIVIAVPPPDAPDVVQVGQRIKEAIDTALMDARESKITGAKTTPFILSRLNDLTQGASVALNIALIKHNASIACDISNALDNRMSTHDRRWTTAPNTNINHHSLTGDQRLPPVDVIVFGACNVDIYVECHEAIKKDGRSHSGSVKVACGGVARNMADALTRLGVRTRLVSAVGEDALGRFVLDYCGHMDLSGVRFDSVTATPAYSGMVENDGLSYGVYQAGNITAEHILVHEDAVRTCSMVVMDSNLSCDALGTAVDLALKYAKPVWLDPTDIQHVDKILSASVLNSIAYLSPNWNEFIVLLDGLDIKGLDHSCYDAISSNPEQFRDALAGIRGLSGLKQLFITMGANGCVSVLCNRTRMRSNDSIGIQLFPAVAPRTPIVNPSGAGDCFNAGIIHGLLHNRSPEACVRLGNSLAQQSLLSWEPVPRTLAACCLP